MRGKRLHEAARLPTRGSDGAGGYDLYWDGRYSRGGMAGEIDTIRIGDSWQTVKLHTGIAVEIPHGYVGLIRERSGLGAKGIALRGGVIDSDYSGEIIVMLRGTDDDVWIEVGDRIAQLVVVPCYQGEVIEVESLSETGRGAAGFGSTGR